MSEWIKVEDKMPDDEQNVLFTNSKLRGLPSTGWYEKDLGFFMHNNFLNALVIVTHWMPLPETPHD